MTVRSERRARHTGLWLFVALLLAAGHARGQQTDEIGLRLIVVRTEAEALDLRARAIAGEAFEVLAAAFSTHSSGASGGFLGTIPRTDLSEAYRQVLEGLAPGDISPVTQVGRDYILLQVLAPAESRWVEETSAGLEAFQSGLLAEAESHLGQAIAVAEGFPGGDYRLNVSLSTLAGVYRAQGKFDQAEPLYRRSLEVVEGVVGNEHPDYASSLSNLALLYSDRGDFTEASRLLEQAQGILVGAYGPSHPDVAAGMVNLARLRRTEGNTARAESLYDTALSIFEQTLGGNHPRVADTLEEIARLYTQLERIEEAARLMTRVGAIRSAQPTN
jgi:tetratricopeptide (TPR) repeat protein